MRESVREKRERGRESVRKSVRERVCVRERERKRVRERETVCERERNGRYRAHHSRNQRADLRLSGALVCVSERESERESVCVTERECV